MIPGFSRHGMDTQEQCQNTSQYVPAASSSSRRSYLRPDAPNISYRSHGIGAKVWYQLSSDAYSFHSSTHDLSVFTAPP